MQSDLIDDADNFHSYSNSSSTELNLGLNLNLIDLQGVPQLSSHFVLVVCCASHASPIIKWSIYFFSWIKIYAKNGITLKN